MTAAARKKRRLAQQAAKRHGYLRVARRKTRWTLRQTRLLKRATHTRHTHMNLIT